MKAPGHGKRSEDVAFGIGAPSNLDEELFAGALEKRDATEACPAFGHEGSPIRSDGCLNF